MLAQPEPSMFLGTMVRSPNKKPFGQRVLSEQAAEDGKSLTKEQKLKEQQEVAKIRYEHYQVRRMRKLALLVTAAEQIALEKRMEKERQDMEYELNKGRKVGDSHVKLPSARGLIAQRQDNFYKVKAKRHMMQTLSPKRDGAGTFLADPTRSRQLQQVQFYQKHNRGHETTKGGWPADLGADLAGDYTTAVENRRAESMMADP